jgi:hypothetical protein
MINIQPVHPFHLNRDWIARPIPSGDLSAALLFWEAVETVAVEGIEQPVAVTEESSTGRPAV